MNYVTPVERLREYLLADMDLVDTATLQVLICALRVMIEARKEEIRKKGN